MDYIKKNKPIKDLEEKEYIWDENIQINSIGNFFYFDYITMNMDNLSISCFKNGIIRLLFKLISSGNTLVCEIFDGHYDNFLNNCFMIDFLEKLLLDKKINYSRRSLDQLIVEGKSKYDNSVYVNAKFRSISGNRLVMISGSHTKLIKDINNIKFIKEKK